MTPVTMFICPLWAPSKSHQFSTMTKTSCYWCQTCQDDDAAAEEGAASCSEWCIISTIAATETEHSRQKRQEKERIKKEKTKKKA